MGTTQKNPLGFLGRTHLPKPWQRQHKSPFPTVSAYLNTAHGLYAACIMLPLPEYKIDYWFLTGYNLPITGYRKESSFTTLILTNGLVAYSLLHCGDRDTTTICLWYTAYNYKQRIVAASTYMPIEEQLPSTMLEQICNYCKQENLPLIVACDNNAHHHAWSCTDTNYRSKMLSEFLATSGLVVANVGTRQWTYHLRWYCQVYNWRYAS